MTRKGLQKGLCIAAILMVTFGLVGMEALRRPVTLGEVIESDMLKTRKVEVPGKVFVICINSINMAKNVITVRGFVDDWDQMEQVKDYFNQRGPFDYPVIHEIDFAGSEDY